MMTGERFWMGITLLLAIYTISVTIAVLLPDLPPAKKRNHKTRDDRFYELKSVLYDNKY